MVNFPDHLIDPKDKDKKWILQYCKAAWAKNAGNSHLGYASSVYKYQRLLDYAHGKQSVSNYRKLLGIEENVNEEWLKVNWEPLSILPRFLEMALARLKRYEYNVIAQPIDAASQAEINDFFKKQEAKLMFREEIEKVQAGLSQISPAAKEQGDPEDFDELKIMREYQWKHQLAAETEEALEAILHDNSFDEEQSQAREHALYFGMSGYKEEIGHDGRIYVRAVNPAQLVLPPFQRKDLKDAEFIGEVRFMTIADLRRLAPELSEKEMEVVAAKYTSQLGNPSTFPAAANYGRPYDDFKIKVLDIEFDSTNMMTYERGVDKRGNKRSRRAPLYKAGKKTKRSEFKSIPVGVVYRACWIVDTNICFNYGLLRNMKRRNADFRKTEKSYHLRCYNLAGGRWTSKLENCTQLVDIIALAWFRLQQSIAEARPANGFAFDLSALEEIPLGKGGKQLQPDQVVDLLLKKNIFPYRSMDSEGNKSHYVPINPLQGGIGNAAAEYFNVIQQNIQLLQQTLGISEVSAGGAPERMATDVAKISDQSTEDALDNVSESERFAFESLLNGISLRIKSLARKNMNKNYQFLIGTESMKFFKLSPLFASRELSIKLENKPDVKEKQELLMLASKYMDGGLLEFPDFIMIKNMDNLKKAEMILSHKIEKRKKQQQEEAMKQQQMNGQIQQQSAMATSQARQQELQLEYQLKSQLIEQEKNWDFKIKQLEVTARLQSDEMKATSNLAATELKNESSEYETELLALLKENRPASKEADDKMRK